MPETIPDQTPNWRKHWFVANVLVEIPVLGSFFKKKSITGALHAAGKCVAAIAGGTAAMMYTVDSHAHTPGAQLTQMTTGMVIGMAAGKIVYNSAYNASLLTYQYCCNLQRANYTLAIDIESPASSSGQNVSPQQVSSQVLTIS